MTTYRNGTFGQHLYGFYQPLTAFNFDHVSTGTHNRCGVFEGLFRRGIRHKRQVSQQQAVWCAATYGGSVVGDIGNGNWQGGVVPLNRHAQRIAHQHDVKPFISKEFGEAIVISGDGRETFFFLFVLLQ